MGFLADLIGNAAIAGGNALDTYQKQQFELERQKAESAQALERASAIEKIRADRAEADRLAKMKRQSEQTQDVEANAPAITAARQLGEAQSRAPSVDSNVLDIIKSKLTPDQLKQFYGVNSDAVSTTNDKMAYARQKGYYDVEADLQKDRDYLVKTLAEERKAAAERYRQDQQDARQAETERHNRAAEGAMWGRINKPDGGGGSGTAERLEVTRAREKRVDIQQQITTVINANKEGLMDTKTAQAELTRLRALQKKYQDIEDGADAAPAAKPAPSAKPAPGTRPPLASFNK